MYDNRKGSDSRCCRPADAPYFWHDFVDASHYAVAELDAWLHSLPPFARLNELGRIDELFEAASEGRIAAPCDDATARIKPIRHDPELWELRYKALSKPLRFYHAEPVRLPRHLVELHRHIKTTGDDQQEQIEYATDRYRISDENDWKQP